MPSSHHHLRSPLDLKISAALFAVLVLAAALLFGATDRIVQLGLVFGLGLGFMIHPPEVPEIPRKWAVFTFVFIAFVVVSQFLPARWFGQTLWRQTLRQDYDVTFLPIRNPEPGRAIDCLLTGFLAVAWFFWVRAMACDRPVRVFLVWALFFTAATVGAVSLILGTRQDFLIYGIRYTPGWTGFGPFPNRNHTAALLAMGALAGGGCLVRAARRKYWVQMAAAILMEIVIIVALLDSKSRGGLLGLGCGLALFAVLAISKLRSRSSVAGSLAGGLLCATLVFSFGSKVLSRFEGAGDGNIPNNLRWQIWQDAITVWKNAPLWGHGLGTFAQIFPLYQTVQAHEQIILHPESSWLLWLDELGIIPVGLGAALLIYFLVRNIVGAMRTGDRGFFIRAGAFAGVFGLLCHGLWDVPIHRWGTAAFGIALLAVACPPLHRRRQIRLGRLAAALPVLIGAFWLMPYIGYPLDWSPDATRLTLERLAISPSIVPLDDLLRIERYFPLSPDLHQKIGVRELLIANRPNEAWREFRVADRLLPGSWAQPAAQAWLSRDYSPGMSFHFWSVAIERADRRADEIFLAACRNSLDLPGGAEYWRSYASGHPEFLLTYALDVAGEDRARPAYDEWWKERGDSSLHIGQVEAAGFYASVRKWGNRAQLEIWMTRHPELEATDYKAWASILHEWRLDADAWSILSNHVTEPAFPDSMPTGESADSLEANWRAHPDDPIAAQAYARQCSLAGDNSRCEQVILAVAAGKTPPPWFIEKAAYLYAARKDYTTAVTSLLRLNTTNS
ncbi:MAG TPA: O-antigen ligase family protein [Chthoniobacteraceae bacterium]|jgi:O-antigen ligase|nr:O-antigen ligase family protein [Chthoniobacteraceae bacterium]